ncbi:hypothetical protein LCGC14_2554510 [marine sediment metagenome]|uniref:Uncharacterized protein n=1 Tax=marine sediment metagenome TaxID=412755 RepID=A0A0F9CY29_9ZZZZ
MVDEMKGLGTMMVLGVLGNVIFYGVIIWGIIKLVQHFTG